MIDAAIPAAARSVIGWHRPEDLRAGDLVHVDEITLSVVAGTQPGRAGSVDITLVDGRRITVCAYRRIAVFDDRRARSRARGAA